MWTLFFMIIGIVIQSIQAKAVVFLSFFSSNYIDWFKLFGTFVEPSYYASFPELFYAIMGYWYYFFFTGGVLSVLWRLISFVIHQENFVRKSPIIKAATT